MIPRAHAIAKRGGAPENGAMASKLLLLDLMRAVYWFDEALQSALSEKEQVRFNHAQSMIFINLALGENRAVRIARNIGVTRQAVSQLLTAMAKRDLVVLRPDPDDGRAQIVEFSPQMATIRKAAEKVLLQLESDLGERIGSKKLVAMREALRADWGPTPTRAATPPPARRLTATGKTAAKSPTKSPAKAPGKKA